MMNVVSLRLILSISILLQGQLFSLNVSDFGYLNSTVMLAKSVSPKSSYYQSFALSKARNFSYTTPFPDTAVKKKLLCAVFLQTSNSSLGLLEFNMKQAQHICDWAVVAYKGDDSILKKIKYRAPDWNSSLVYYKLIKPGDYEQLQNSEERISKWNGTAATINIPKPLLYFHLQHLLPYYQRIWLLDEDISFQNFNIFGFLQIHLCYHYPLPPHLIAQPLIYENTQGCRFMNRFTWRRHKFLGLVTNYIEQQVPIIETLFFDWFLTYIITPLKKAIEILGNDMSFDEVWCRAAMVFAKERYRWNTKIRESCFLVIGGTPIRHKNTKELYLWHDRRDEYIFLGNVMRNLTRLAFPDWMIPVGKKCVDLSGTKGYLTKLVHPVCNYMLE